MQPTGLRGAAVRSAGALPARREGAKVWAGAGTCARSWCTSR